MGFTHFHVHTEFSALDGMSRLNELVQAAVDDGQEALAITDHGSLAGTYRFRKACMAAGIKPVLGEEVYMAIGGNRFEPQTLTVAADDATVLDGDDENSKTKTKAYHHLTVLAATTRGWENLCRMHAASQMSFRKKPLIDERLLAEHAEGLIVLTGCLGGPVAGPASRGDVDEARAALDRLIDAVGADNLYVEVMQHGIAAEDAANEVLVDLAEEYDLPLIATNDSHYTHCDDDETHAHWLNMQADGFSFNGGGYHLRTEDEMRALSDENWWIEACDNTKIITDRIADDVFPPQRMRLSKFDLPDGFDDPQDYLHHVTKAGAKERYGGLDDELKERLRWEEDVIGGHHGTPNYSDYFLIVRDIVAHAREVGGIVGPGRGSGAGSATAYANEITNVEPLENRLLFERFMEPGRVELPDFDIDFQPSRRPELIRYVQDKYGFDRVARIGSFGTAKSPGALKAAADVLGLKSVADKLVPTIPKPHNIPLPLTELIDADNADGKDFRATVQRIGDDATEVVDLAVQIEGLTRAFGIHACGVLLSDEDLPGLIPLRRDRRAEKKGSKEPECWVSEWDADDVQDYGMLKLDFLTLNNFDVIAYCLDVIEQATGEKITFDDLPEPDDYDDPRVQAAYRLMQKGHTVGLFQIEDDGMRALCRDMQPENLDDLSAVSALYRPGPLANNMHTRYVERKTGREQVSYRDWTSDPVEAEWIDKVLGRTHGVYVYQEQLMQLGEVVAGFDAPLRSKLRKAVSKKKKDLLDEVGALFMAGAVVDHHDESGELISPAFSRQTAERLWESMQTSADYLFNKSHSVAYGKITFATAVLKANWPAEYGAAVISLNSNSDKRQAMIRDLLRAGIEVLPPDLNRSGVDTSVIEQPDESKAVIFGLEKVRSVSSAAGAIIAEREKNGEFTSVRDVMDRVRTEEGRKITTAVIDSLIAAGACDQWGSRAGQMAIVRASDPDAAPFDWEWGVLERSVRQRHALSVALNEEHPLSVFADFLDQWRPPGTPDDGFRPAKPTPLSKIGAGLAPGEQRPFYTIALLDGWERKPYSGGRYRAQVTLSDADTTMDGVIWHDDLETISRNNVPAVGSVVALQGRAKTRVVQLRNDDDTGEEGEFVETVQLTITSMMEIDVPDSDSISHVDTNVVTLGELRERFSAPSDDDPEPTPPKPRTRKRSTEPVEPEPSTDEADAVESPVDEPDTVEDEPPVEQPAAARHEDESVAPVIPLRKPREADADEQVFVVALNPGDPLLYGVPKAPLLITDIDKATRFEGGKGLATRFPPEDVEVGSVLRIKINDVVLMVVVDPAAARRSDIPADLYRTCLTLHGNDAVWTVNESEPEWEQVPQSWFRQALRTGVS